MNNRLMNRLSKRFPASRRILSKYPLIVQNLSCATLTDAELKQRIKQVRVGLIELSKK